MSDWIKVVIQGLVQGITEFLPISSTGHLLVVGSLLDFGEAMEGTFEIVIQLGTLLAILVYFRRELWEQVLQVRSDRAIQSLWLNIIIASIPISVVGFLLVDFITTTLYSENRRVPVVAFMLLFGGVIFLWIEKSRIQSQSDGQDQVTSIYEISRRQALVIGLAQAVALIPGTSRSGASIVGGLLAGLDRATAAIFSFYLAIPALGGATLITLLTSLDELQEKQLGFLALGALVAGLAGWVVIGWLLRYLASNSFAIFGYYRILAGIVLLALMAMGLM